MADTTIAVVTALSPSGTTLAEYGLHLLAALGRKPNTRVLAFVEADSDLAYPEIPGVEIIPTWRFGSAANPLRIARAVRRSGADVALFNAHFTSFGSGKVAATLGLLSTLAVKATGVPTICLLHNIVETVDLGAAGFDSSGPVEWALRSVASAVTWLLLRNDLVTTTMPRYVEILRSKYDADNVALTPHGSFETPGAPTSRPDRPRIMTFGKFGTYKRVDTLIEAFRQLENTEAELVIAGTDSPNTPGYLADLEARFGGDRIHFTGYVAEEDVEATFRSATVTVFPYVATTGSSGVLHQAGSYGCPPVLPAIGDLQDLIRDEGYDGIFFEPGNAQSLAAALEDALANPHRLEVIAAHNHRAAVGLSIDDVVDWYLLHIGTLVHGDHWLILRDEVTSGV